MTTQPNAQQSGAGGAAAPSGFMQAWGTYVGLLVVLAGMIALFSFLSEYFWSKEHARGRRCGAGRGLR